MKRTYAVCKRLIDIVGSAACIAVLSPVFAVCAVAIKLDSPGPVFYRGLRIGRGRKSFMAYKFRSMRVGTDDEPHAAYVRRLMTEGADSADMYKLTEDDRVTRVGRVLRRWSLDELPQLFNVLRGEMSLVGPRPEVPYALDVYEPWQYKRFDVLPGITGLWQVAGRAKLTPRQMLELDCIYAAEQSLRLDTKILIRTIPAVLTRTGAA